MKGAVVIASTLGFDLKGFNSEHRYQSTRTSRAIYSVGESYFSVGNTPPKDVCGSGWELYSDQFFAQKGNTKLWISKPLEEE